MSQRLRYKKKPTAFVTAVQLDLDMDGFSYYKWGSIQVCKRGDWLVDNNGDTYTISKETFERTYEMISPGVYHKSTTVWAEVAEEHSILKTNEGETEYKQGDYLVYNDEESQDAYAVNREKFESMYDIET